MHPALGLVLERSAGESRSCSGSGARARGNPGAVGWVPGGGPWVRVAGRPGWRVVGLGGGACVAACPVGGLQIGLKLARIGRGPLFRRVTGGGKEVGPDRLADKHVARLVKRAALAAGVRSLA